MAVVRFIFHFDDGKPKKKGELPFIPQANISLGSHSYDNEGNHYLMPNCASETEFKYHLNEIIRQFQEIRKMAEREFAKM